MADTYSFAETMFGATPHETALDSMNIDAN
jgi:hypothetical protein